MSRKIELLAPGGDIDSIKAAIIAGADAIYCGLNKFNARNRAENITFDNLNGILHLAHNHNCEVFLTLNVGIVETEIPDIFRLLSKLVNTSVDAVIVQDLGLFYIIKKYFPSLPIHASTQLTTHNKAQLLFLKDQGVNRINLSRELNTTEITELSILAKANNLLTEVFVHGSYCISFSGICYMSSVSSGKSGNRGQCSQPCRDAYVQTKTGHHFPLNLKDNSAWFNLQELYDAGVNSLKIEGRIKKFHYVYAVVKAYRKQLNSVLNKTEQSANDSVLYTVFNRDFTNGYLTGVIHKNMFIDNTRDNSPVHLARTFGELSEKNLEKAEAQLYAQKGKMRASVKSEIEQLSISKVPLQLYVSGKANECLRVVVKITSKTFAFTSQKKLLSEGSMALDEKMLLKRFKVINDTEYFIEKLVLDKLDKQLYISFSQLTELKNQILLVLNKGRKTCPTTLAPKIQYQGSTPYKSKLSVLVNSKKEYEQLKQHDVDFYFQLPNQLIGKSNQFIELFQKYKTLRPWFPSVLIGENYNEAVRILASTRNKTIVSNNLGIVYDANQKGINCVAGPLLNIYNSYAIKNLNENNLCTGAFISNELNRQQIKRIRKPDNFNLYYSIYHPILLMNSRQCFFQTTVGCHKEKMDENCVDQCIKEASIKNLKGERFLIDKSRGSYNEIYNQTHFLNTDIVKDIPSHFSNYLIDLRNVHTATKQRVSSGTLILLFDNYLRGVDSAENKLKEAVLNWNNNQYFKGI